MWRSVRTWIFGVAKPRKSVPKCGVACRLGFLGVSKPRKFVPKRCAACGLGFLGSRNPGSSFQNVAQRADLVFWGLGRGPSDEARLARVRIRWGSLGFRPLGSGAAETKQTRKRALGPCAEKRAHKPWVEPKRKGERVCVCFVGGAGATEPFWVSQIGGGTPEVAGPWAAPPDGTGRSSPRSLVGNLGFHKWGFNHRVASPWAAPPNGMLESPVAGWQSWVSQMGVQPPGREPVGCPSQRDGALEPAVP